MSTRSYIACKKGDKVKYIYCHYDGYPGGVGMTLKLHYNNVDIINKLIKSGDHSTLTENPEEDTYVSRGENYDDVKYRVVSYEYWLNKIIKESSINYFYMYDIDNETWYVWDYDNMYNKEELKNII